VEPDDIGGAGRLTFDEMQRVDAALRLVLGLRRQSLIGTGWNALRQSCTYAVTANARWMSVEYAAAHWFWMTAGSLLRCGWFACGPSSGSAECSGGYAGECVAPLSANDQAANLAKFAKPRDPCIRTVWTRHLGFPWPGRVQPPNPPRQIAASRYVGCMAAVATSPIVAVTMTYERKP
jgi:hypothetical protein